MKMEQNEEWRSIPGADGYSASSFGKVSGPRGELKPSTLNSGYLGVKVARRGTTVHEAVLSAFAGPRPSRAHTVNHKNGDKKDNRAENLEWMTQAENNRHAVEVLCRKVGRTAKPKRPDNRGPITLDLRSYGAGLYRIEPQAGYIACRLIDAETGTLLQCAALKTLLHTLADNLPRRMGLRNCA